MSLTMSAYRSAHSTETALVIVSNDIMQVIDNTESVFLVLSDMSAAFNTLSSCQCCSSGMALMALLSSGYIPILLRADPAGAHPG